MNISSPMTDQQLAKYSFLFSAVKKNMGFVPNSMKTMAREPAILAAFTSLSGILLGNPEKTSPLLYLKLVWKNIRWSSRFMNKKDRIPLYLRNLVSHVSSNASGCRYCQAHTISEARHNGVSDDQLKAIWNFEESPLFNDAEKAALRFGYAAGCVPNEVHENHFAELRRYYSEDQIIEIGAIVALFGFLNRWNDTFGTTLEHQPLAHAQELLSSSGWSIGKHR